MDKIQEQQIIEGNKLIAEFMGGERHWLNGMKEPFTDDTIWGYYDVGVNITSTYSGRPIALVNDLKYHTSWDWLMPVVEKIELGDGVRVDIYQFGCKIFRYGKLLLD